LLSARPFCELVSRLEEENGRNHVLAVDRDRATREHLARQRRGRDVGVAQAENEGDAVRVDLLGTVAALALTGDDRR
jgi:hypothetical protein